MTVSHASTGAVNSGSASCAPAFPTVVAANEMAVLSVAWGNDTDAPPATPSGWTLLGTWIGGAGSWGVDDGHRGITVFCKITDGTEDLSTVTVNNGGTGASRVTTGQIVTASKTAAAWYISIVGSTDDTNDTSFSIAPATDPGAVAGDLAYAAAVWRPDSVTPVSPTIVYPGIGASGTTSVQSIANTNGNDLRFLLYRRNLGSGTSSGAPSFTSSPASAVSGAGAIIVLHDGAVPTIDVDDATHAHSATSPTLTPSGATAVEPDDASHTHTATSPTLTQHQVLSVDSGSHAHTATSPTLTQHQVLAVDNASHAHSATSPALTQHHTLSVDAATHAHTATSPALTQHHVLAPSDALHTHSATSPTLTQHHALTVDSSAHAHTATSPALTQHHVLSVDSSTHAHAATSPTLDTAGAATVTPDNATHAHVATSPTLTQRHILTVDSGAHGHVATSPTLTQLHVLTVDSATHAHAATSPTLRIPAPTPPERTSVATGAPRISTALGIVNQSTAAATDRTSTAPGTDRTSN